MDAMDAIQDSGCKIQDVGCHCGTRKGNRRDTKNSQRHGDLVEELDARCFTLLRENPESRIQNPESSNTVN